MWYIFPQIKGLGKTAKCKKFELSNLEEAKEKVASNPHGGPKHPIHLTWSNLAIRLEKNIETYLYIIDSIESGNKKSNKYKFHS